MSLISNYFNKESITDILYEDVAHYFNSVKEENDKMEYKSFVNDERENQSGHERNIIKSVCGFLNSDGGLLLWGAPKGTKLEGRKEKVFQGELSLVEYPYEKDSFISMLTDSITPAPRGILFHRIEKNEKYFYIIEIPISEYSPHQFKNTYYMRIDGQTKPAPHHYVEALMRKIRFPNLAGYIKFENCIWSNDVIELYLHVFIFNLSKLQNDYNVSYRLICNYGQFQGWDAPMFDKRIRIGEQGKERAFTNIKEIIHYGEPISDYFFIRFKRYEWEKTKPVIEFLLHFGAKYSPMRASNYKLVLQRSSENLQDCIVELNENKYMYEVKEQLGVTDEESILRILGRTK